MLIGLPILPAARRKSSLFYLWIRGESLDLLDMWFYGVWKVMQYQLILPYCVKNLLSVSKRSYFIYVLNFFIWICALLCFNQLFCGHCRYKEGHGVRHWKDTQHCYSLELISQQIWDYVGDGYVHRLTHSKVDGKPVEINSRCTSIEGTCHSCGYGDDSGINEAIYSSKVEAVYCPYK